MLLHVDQSIVHYLSRLIRVLDEDGISAKAGDLLVVEILNLGPLPGDEWGYTTTFERENGGRFLTDHFPCATKAIWYFKGIYAYSPHIPSKFSIPNLSASFGEGISLLMYFTRHTSVRFPCLTHPGIIGKTPFMELLSMWNEREIKLEENCLETLKLCEVLHSQPLVNLPSTKDFLER